MLLESVPDCGSRFQMRSDSLTPALVSFSRALRARHVRTGPASAADMAEALIAVDVGRAEDAFYALRAITISRPDQRRTFAEEFVRAFGGNLPHTDHAPEGPPSGPLSYGLGAPGAGEAEEEATADAGASDIERFAHRDFADLDEAEAARVREVIARMVWQPGVTASRRFAPAERGRRPDVRRSFRDSVSPTGDLVPLRLSDRRVRQRPLIVIADVSGSMERYAEMLLVFAHSAAARLGRVETFTFSTRLTRVTHQLRRRDPVAALRATGAAVDDWSGGTRIGDAIEAFVRQWARRVGRGGPVVLIVSDGWDCGPPEQLSAAMRRLQRFVHKIIWLNPLAGQAGFAPETKGMKAALPFIDDLVAGANIADLRRVVRLLESSIA